MRVRSSYDTTQLFGTASAWIPPNNSTVNNCTVIAGEIASIYSSEVMNIQRSLFKEGETLTSNAPDRPGWQWQVQYETKTMSCYSNKAERGVTVAAANSMLLICSVEETSSTYSTVRNGTRDYLSPYDVALFLATTCNSIEEVQTAFGSFIVWDQPSPKENSHPLGMKLLIQSGIETLILSFKDGVPQFDSTSAGIIGTAVSEQEIANLAGGYVVDKTIPPDKKINGCIIKSPGPGGGSGFTGGYSSLSKIERLVSLMPLYVPTLSLTSTFTNIQILWPPFSGTVTPLGASTILVDSDVYDISARIFFFVTKNGISLGSLQEASEPPPLHQVNPIPALYLKEQIDTAYYFQGLSVMHCGTNIFTGLGNINGLSFDINNDGIPFVLSNISAGSQWTSRSSTGVTGFTWTQSLSFVGIFTDQPTDNIPTVQFAQNDNLMIRALNLPSSTYSSQFIENQSVGAADLVCLIAGSCGSIAEVKKLLSGNLLGPINVADQQLISNGSLPHLQYHISTNPNNSSEAAEIPIVLRFKEGSPVFDENPRNIAVSDYSISECERYFAQLGSIVPNQPLTVDSYNQPVLGPIGSGTKLLPQSVNALDNFSKAAFFRIWNQVSTYNAYNLLLGSTQWDGRVQIQADGTKFDLSTLANYLITPTSPQMWKGIFLM